MQGKEKKLLFLKIHPWGFSNMEERCKKFYRKLDYFFFSLVEYLRRKEEFSFRKEKSVRSLSRDYFKGAVNRISISSQSSKIILNMVLFRMTPVR